MRVCARIAAARGDAAPATNGAAQRWRAACQSRPERAPRTAEREDRLGQRRRQLGEAGDLAPASDSRTRPAASAYSRPAARAAASIARVGGLVGSAFEIGPVVDDAAKAGARRPRPSLSGSSWGATQTSAAMVAGQGSEFMSRAHHLRERALDRRRDQRHVGLAGQSASSPRAITLPMSPGPAAPSSATMRGDLGLDLDRRRGAAAGSLRAPPARRLPCRPGPGGRRR